MSGLLRIPRILRLPKGASRYLDRWTGPLRNVLSDYTYVAKDTGVYIKKHPIRFMLMCLTGCGASAMWIKNPEMNGFIEEVLDYSNEISQCSELTRNKAAQNYLQNLIMMHHTGLIRYLNLGICSLIIMNSNYKDCHNFSEKCEYLQPKWWEFHDSLLDIGFWGRWWCLEREMVDFDVNTDELTDFK